MSLILNIETSSKNCSISLSLKGKLLSNLDIEDDKFKHSELLTTSIRDILNQNKYNVNDLSAVAIGTGPGSFTGLRIGFSVAKGLCYPHKIYLNPMDAPFIPTWSRVKSAIPDFLIRLEKAVNEDNKFIIPMIRDKGEFFYTTIYNNKLNVMIEPKVEKISHGFLDKYSDENYSILTNTKESFEYIKSFNNSNLELRRESLSSLNMIELSYKSFLEKRFEDLAYFEPYYLKKPYVF